MGSDSRTQCKQAMASSPVAVWSRRSFSLILTVPLVVWRSYWRFPPSPSGSLGMRLFPSAPYSLSRTRQLSDWQWSVILIFNAYFCHFYYPNIYLISFYFFSLGENRTQLFACILSMSFCNPSVTSVLVLVHLAGNWCFIGSLLTICQAFWARNYYFFCLGNNITIFEKQFPQIRGPTLILWCRYYMHCVCFFLLCKFLIFSLEIHEYLPAHVCLKKGGVMFLYELSRIISSGWKKENTNHTHG